MAQVGFPRLYSVFGAPDARWDLQSCTPDQLSGVLAAKASNPDLIVLLTHSSTGTFPNIAVTYGAAFIGFGGATDNIIDGQAANAGVIRPYSATWDIMYNADGTQTAGFAAFPHPIYNLANIAHSIGLEKTWQTVARFILWRLKQNRLYRDAWAGYRSDNWMSVHMGGYGGSQMDSDRDGVVDASTALRGWWGNGLNALGKYLRDSLPGKIVGGNNTWAFSPHYQPASWTPFHDDPDAWKKYANFTEVEQGYQFMFSQVPAKQMIDICRSLDMSIDPTTGGTRGGWLTFADPYGQERYLAFFHELHDDSAVVIPTPPNFNSPSVYKQEQYYKPARKGLAFAAICGAYYFPLFRNQHTSKLYYDDEMLGGVGVARRNWMGDPIGTYTNPVSGVFMQEFENGLAIVNVSGGAQTVSLPGGSGVWRKINGTAAHNDGATLGATFQIPARDGRLFVRIGGAPEPVTPPVNLTAPTISGTPSVGQALAPTRGTWANSPTSFTLIFARYSTDGATRLATLQTQVVDVDDPLDTYTIVAGDAGFTIKLEVTAGNGDGNGSAVSLPTAVVDAPAASERFEARPSTMFDFTIASVSAPSSFFRPSTMFAFTVGPGRIINFLRTTQIRRRIDLGARRPGEGGGG